MKVLFLLLFILTHNAYCDTKREIVETVVEIMLIDRINDSFIERILNSTSSMMESQYGGAEYNSNISAIGRTLMDSSKPLKKKGAENYRFEVLRTSDVNAYSLGRNIYISEGLINLLDNDPDMIAGVLAHELAHSRQKHSVSSFKRYLKLNLAILPKIGANGTDEVLAKGFLSFLINAGYSRSAEAEADKLGVEYLKKTAYSPFGLTLALQRLKSREKGSMPKLMSTHPPTNERIMRTNKFASSGSISPKLVVTPESNNDKVCQEIVKDKEKTIAEELGSKFLGNGEWDIVKFDRPIEEKTLFGGDYNFYAFKDGKEICQIYPVKKIDNQCRFETKNGVEFPKVKFRVMMVNKN